MSVDGGHQDSLRSSCNQWLSGDNRRLGGHHVWLGTHEHWLGGDDRERLAASFDLSGYLAPGAEVTEGGVNTVARYIPLDAVAVTYSNPHGQGHRWSACWERDQLEEEPQHIQQGETEALSKLRGGNTGKTRKAPKGKTTDR